MWNDRSEALIVGDKLPVQSLIGLLENYTFRTALAEIN
jgi:hypothetical protein